MKNREIDDGMVGVIKENILNTFDHVRNGERAVEFAQKVMAEDNVEAAFICLLGSYAITVEALAKVKDSSPSVMAEKIFAIDWSDLPGDKEAHKDGEEWKPREHLF